MPTRTLALLLVGTGLALTTAACTSGTTAQATTTQAPTAQATTTPTVAASTSPAASPSRPSASAGPSSVPAPSASAVSQVRLAADGAYPFQAALLNMATVDDAGKPAADDRARLSCGGSLIDERHVLTAGHCFTGESENPPDPLRDIRVVVGRTTLTSRQGQVRRITHVELHPRYRDYPPTYDVAVVTLDRPVTGIAPVTLVPPGDASLQRAGRLATFTGWGSLNPHRDGDISPVSLTDRMKQADVPLLADDACRSAYQRHPNENRPDLRVSLCTSTANKIGHCSGDSGGPLFVTDGGRVVQLGVVSFSPGCGDPRYPSVYARLSNDNINAFIRKAVASAR